MHNTDATDSSHGADGQRRPEPRRARIHTSTSASRQAAREASGRPFFKGGRWLDAPDYLSQMKNETWRSLAQFKRRLAVSNRGRVIFTATSKLVRPRGSSSHGPVVTFYYQGQKETYPVARLMWTAGFHVEMPPSERDPGTFTTAKSMVLSDDPHGAGTLTHLGVDHLVEAS